MEFKIILDRSGEREVGTVTRPDIPQIGEWVETSEQKRWVVLKVVGSTLVVRPWTEAD